MEDYQLRVVDEKKELDKKIGKLELFLKSEKYESLDYQEQIRLKWQLRAMNEYTVILAERIAEFLKSNKPESPAKVGAPAE